MEYSTKAKVEAMFEHGKTWPLFKDFNLQMVDAEKFKQMAEADEISSPDYWSINKGFGLVLDATAYEYSITLDKLKQGLCDFGDGYSTGVKDSTK